MDRVGLSLGGLAGHDERTAPRAGTRSPVCNLVPARGSETRFTGHFGWAEPVRLVGLTRRATKRMRCATRRAALAGGALALRCLTRPRLGHGMPRQPCGESGGLEPSGDGGGARLVAD